MVICFFHQSCVMIFAPRITIVFNEDTIIPIFTYDERSEEIQPF